ncbi:hypothetical protein C2W62_26160 [Candidatus Entotheonella serta]|nr:hypothetical protein C2W62_26160 [Candidatus Entotheonella serta]
MTKGSMLILAIALIFSGCAYRGAVYSEYTHYGIGIRSAVEEASPINVEVGYGRGVYALVPKREGGLSRGEAASLISKNNLGSDIRPRAPDTDTEEILQVDAQFVSGAAAVAAVLPENSVLMINSAVGTEDATVNLQNVRVDVQGEPMQRLSAAFSPSARFTLPEQETFQKLLDQIDALPETAKQAI